ncbi:MAG: ribosome recycling factor [Alphaproteobacteria bacterium]|nr:ribosome recycling factor [Alphaproteobacteria bacterium]MBF0249481.1 ribosome recycling factor [Alphaproteobacteria bacterium]
MADIKALKADLKRRMEGALEVLHKEFSGLRTGRASVNLLDPITVEAYGQAMPLNQVGTVSAPEPRMLSVQVWDRSMAKAVEKAIMDSGLGLNPQADGQLIRIPIPPLNEERRKELVKVAGKYAEEARVAVRNVRRHGMDELKKAEKDGDISEDALHQYSDEVQKMTDSHVAEVDTALSHKEEEIMQV